jgi:ribosomal protein S18 acetylase RimI-like enzyme
MAALRESILPSLELIDLKRIAGRELDPILLEETVEWHTALDWDFSRSADLVRQYADLHALSGYVLLDRGEVAGYGYSVIEEHKGLVGDIYLRPAWRAGEGAVRLLRATLHSLVETPQVRRIESQLMLADTGMGRALEREGRVSVYERMLMTRAGGSGLDLPDSAGAHRFVFEPWAEHHSEMAAETIMLAYQNHVDSRINDQYRSVWGARRFLHNIVQYPGCGNFYRPGSFVAFDPETGTLAGLVLASFVHAATGHVTQLCVTPSMKGRALGYELLRRSVEALRAGGATRLSLTVTVGNNSAIDLYQRCGFRDTRRFLAYAWDRD